jgi:formate hydrogenlyase subunit 3/multisubunit Na+/H+ antiporter MnhD subunit
MTNGTMILAGALAGLGAAVLGALLPRRLRMAGAALGIWAACALEVLAAIQVLTTRQPVNLHVADLLSLTGVDIALTPLGALFVLLVALVAAPASLHAVGYARHGLDSRTASAAFPLFVTTMLLVPQAGGVATFMVLWELMALLSLLLVLIDHFEHEAARSAGAWYAALTHGGAAFILAAFLLLDAGSAGQSFAAISHHAPGLGPLLRGSAFVAALVGFGSKAGVVPFHVWLPKAHPEAPGPVSALMSGAMVALGVYGIVLTGDVLLGGGPGWWWLLVLVLGATSALYGSLHTASSTDLKRLLAYSTTDNIGLAMMSLGVSGYFAATQHRLLGAMALVAAFVLLVNHAAFKGALFLSAGSVQYATGTRDLDQLGGLLRRMPQSGAMFLLASAAIAALPPLNGFIGEWLLFQSLLHGAGAGSTASDVAIPVAVAAMALTAGLTVVAFVKAAGIGFLGRPRSSMAEQAVEVAPSMRIGVGILVATCVALGVAPGVMLPAVERAAQSSLRGLPAAQLSSGVGLQLAGFRGALASLEVAGGLVVAIIVVIALRRSFARRPAPRFTEAWGCGRELQTARMQYTATSFAEPVQRVFDNVLRPVHDLDISHPAESRYYIESATYHSAVGDVVERGLYMPVIRAFGHWGRIARGLQPGSLHRYLGYGFGALVVVLIAVAVLA